MTEHNHREHMPWCYRCELSADEARDIFNESLEGFLPELADARNQWLLEWENANRQPDGRSGLGYDIEQGWDAAWDCVEQHLPVILKAVREEAWRAGFQEGEGYEGVPSN